jgi:transposase
MTYFFKKKLKDKYYLFAGKSKSDGKGNAIRTESKYIGSYDDLCEYFKQTDATILYQAHFEFGLSRVLYTLAKQLGLLQVLQNNIIKKTADAHLPMRIMIMVINRIVWPCAKYSVEKWYSKSDLCNTIGMPASELESQKVYRAMDKLDQYSASIEIALCKIISAQEGVSFQTLYLDFTNQESYSRNHDSELLAYGHNKRGRHDLYQINISLCCDADSGIPFFHKTYAGNYNDKQFIHQYAQELRQRLSAVGCKGRTLLVIDRGINGKDNFDLLFKNQFDYIGGLIEREFPTYFEIPKSSLTKRFSHKREAKLPLRIRYLPLDDQIYGKKHKVIIFYNQENYDEKVKQLEIDLSEYATKCIAKLSEFKQEIQEKTFQSHWANTDKIIKQIKEINKKLFPLLKFKIKSYRFELSWKISRNEKTINQHIDKFGKHVLFTNKTELKDKDILELFFNKDKIEKNFQYLKSNAYTNRSIVLAPMLHSKDERITGHVYTCIIALQIYQILRHRLNKAEIELTTQEALEDLEEIACYYTKILGKEEAIRHINPLTERQKKILKAIQINIFD